MITTTILVNLFSQSMKQAIFYMFNLLQQSATKDDKSMKFIDSEMGVGDPEVHENDTLSESDTTVRQYSLRERKPVNYKV
jgi:hypothetical protein